MSDLMVLAVWTVAFAPIIAIIFVVGRDRSHSEEIKMRNKKKLEEIQHLIKEATNK